MRFSKTLFVSLSLFLGTINTAFAAVQIHIDLNSQRMYVKSSSGDYTWKVSTARAGYTTPRGSYSAVALKKMHYSTRYHNSPMPHSIFFRGNFAIHGTYETGRLGRPASHGCVRLAPGHAEKLFHMVQAEGASITITGSPPASSKTKSTPKAPGFFGQRTNTKRQNGLDKALASR